MRELISPEELKALFESSCASDLPTDREDETDLQMEIVDSEETVNLVDHYGADVAGKREIPECLVSLYASLSLGSILFQCHQMLKQRLPLEFFTLVQSRKSKSVVSVYSPAEIEKPSYSPPEIVELIPSRLSDCALIKQKILKYVAENHELDDTEKHYLIPKNFRKSDVTIVYWPVLLDGNLSCILVLGLNGKIQLSDDQNTFLTQLCTHLPVAVRNSDIHYNERRRSRQLEMLSEIASEAVFEDDFESFLSKVCESIRKSFNYSSVQVWIGTGSRLDILGHNSIFEMPADYKKAISVIVGECWNQNRIQIKNYGNEEFGKRFKGMGNSCFVVPIHLQNDRAGVLFIESPFVDGFYAEDIAVVKNMASIISSRYSSIRMLNDYQRSGEYLKAVLESADDWAILFTDNHGYVLSSSIGVEHIFNISQKEAIGRDVLTIFEETDLQRELLAFMKDEQGQDQFQHYQATQKNPEGTIHLDVNFQRVCDAEKQHIGFVGVVQNITDKVIHEDKLKEQSLKDDLTNLYNQRGFFGIIKRNFELCRKLKCNLALCFMDLDHLKQCNDTLGHLYGSQAIKDSADILRKSVRAQDTCCRYGGDEFVVIMPQFDKQEAAPLIEKIRVSIQEHFGGKITGSFGIADLSENVQTIKSLVAKADEALYRAKSLGRNRVVVAD